MAHVEQVIGGIVLFGAALAVLAYGGGYLWYRVVRWPLFRRHARRRGIVVVGSNIYGDDVFVDYARDDWRPMTFGEWRKAPEGRAAQAARVFDETELLC